MTSNFTKYLATVLNSYIYVTRNTPGELVLFTSASSVKKILSFLKKHTNTQFEILTDLTAIDYIANTKQRFQISYNLISIRYQTRFRVQTSVNNYVSIDSVESVYPNSNWLEREVWDMYGIAFNKHTDLRRILTDYGFPNFPLRKDFPVSGYTEVEYNDTKKRVVIQTVSVKQDTRNFKYNTSWQNFGVYNLRKN